MFNENQFKKTGGIFVWDLAAKEKMTYAQIKQKFGTLPPYTSMQFTWHRNKNLPTIHLQVVFIAPG